jgi:tether containing UBX domain for GLUT4
MDRTQLEKSFPSSSKIKSIYAFVRSCLRQDVQPIKFVLCKRQISCLEDQGNP